MFIGCIAERSWRAPLALIALTVAGCSGGGDRLAVSPASGTVTYEGQPVANAQVVFRSKGSAPAATASTAADGRFRLSTYEEHDGAAPGTYLVTVVKLEGGATTDPNAPFDPVADMEAAAKSANQPAPAPAKSLIPEKYATPSQTPLEFTVQASGNNEFKIELTD